MKNKTFIYTLIIVLLLGAGVYMWLWPFSVPGNMVENEMEEKNEEEKKEIVLEEGDIPGWQKYTSEDWGFEIQIPDGWSVEEGRLDESNPNVKSGNAEVGELAQINLRGDGYSVVINKNRDIAVMLTEEVREDFERRSEDFERIMAGQNVEITEITERPGGELFFQRFSLFFSEDYYFFRVSSNELESREIIYSIVDTFRIL